MNPMQTFQVTLKGYDPSTSETDHLVKWVNATNIIDVQTLAATQGWEYTEIEPLSGGHCLTYEDGVDFIIPESPNPSTP
jgi:hypothetical protein